MAAAHALGILLAAAMPPSEGDPAAAPDVPSDAGADPDLDAVPWSTIAWSPDPRLPLPRAVTAAVGGILSLLALAGAIAGSPSLPAFTDSMAVFERPQTAADAAAAREHFNLPGAGPDADIRTVRRAGEPAEGVEVLVYRSTDGGVCLAIFFADGGGGGRCASEADFRERGIGGGTLFPPSEWHYDWGPLGEPVVTRAR